MSSKVVVVINIEIAICVIRPDGVLDIDNLEHDHQGRQKPDGKVQLEGFCPGAEVNALAQGGL